MGTNKGSKKGKKPAFLAAAEAEATEAAKAKSKTKKVIRGAAAKADVDAGRKTMAEVAVEQVETEMPQAPLEATKPAEKDPRVHVISVRVSREEADALMALADEADMRLAAWARHVLLEGLKP